MNKVIATKNAPGAIGPYSQAILAGDTLYCSGQIALIPETGEMVENDIALQTRQVLTNLGAVLKEAGMGYENVVKTTCLLKSMDDFVPMNKVYAEFFTKDCPARVAYEVGKLPKDALVEIDCIAVK